MGPLCGPGSKGSKGGGGGRRRKFYKKGARLRRGLCRRVVFASAQGATITTALRVVDCPSGNTYEVSVTDLAFCIIWNDRHSAAENHTTGPGARWKCPPSACGISSQESVSRNFQSPYGSLQISFACHPGGGDLLYPYLSAN